MRIIFISILWLLTYVAYAETIYVIDELKIGLHKNPSISSPIMKLVPSGTALSVIERENDLIYVQEPEGAQGWINNKYVVTKKPGKARVNELEKEIELLKSMMTTIAGTGDQQEIQQQLKSERLKSGALQATLTDIEQLKLENTRLISQLESSGIEVSAEISSMSSNATYLHGWKQIAMIFILVLIIGMLAGAFIFDLLARRRHGGFRI